MSTLHVTLLTATAVTAADVCTSDVGYNQTTPAVEDSTNVTSVSDDATGLFTVNFTSSYGSASYGLGRCPSLGASEQWTNVMVRASTTPLTGSFQGQCTIVTGAEQDRENIDIAVVGALA